MENEYFGGDVSVAGLLTGQDFLNVRDRIRGNFVIIPRVTLKSDEPIMLDGMTLDEVKKQFAQPVHAVDLPALAQMILAPDMSISSQAA